MKLNVVITCAGVGKRFLEAGYAVPKYLIRVQNKLVLTYVVDMFDQVGVEPNFVFIARQEDLDNPDLHVLEAFEEATEGRPWRHIGIEGHALGPVFTIQSAYDLIPDDEPVVVSYCDLYNDWSAFDFLTFIANEQADGCIVTHKGFHPHRLNNVSFAYLRTDGHRVLEVKEKACFTDHPVSEPASNGIYYFKAGSLLKHYGDELIAEGWCVKGEYYMTMTYNLMIQDRLKVVHYETDNFWPFGTPEDLENCAAWLTLLKWKQIKNEEELVQCWRYWLRVKAKTASTTGSTAGSFQGVPKSDTMLSPPLN